MEDGKSVDDSLLLLRLISKGTFAHMLSGGMHQNFYAENAF
jgi:hypothetical protein